MAKILDLVENSSSKKARAENFITKFARYYTPAVVIAALLLAQMCIRDSHMNDPLSQNSIIYLNRSQGKRDFALDSSEFQ